MPRKKKIAMKFDPNSEEEKSKEIFGEPEYIGPWGTGEHFYGSSRLNVLDGRVNAVLTNLHLAIQYENECSKGSSAIPMLVRIQNTLALELKILDLAYDAVRMEEDTMREAAEEKK